MGISTKIVSVAKQILPTGSNMAKKIGRTTKRANGYLEQFYGTKQVLNGKTVVKGVIETKAPRGVYNSTPDRYLTKISKQTPNGSKEVSRMVPCKENNFTVCDDITKVTTKKTAQVGAHRVNTFNQKAYEYNDYGLYISERTIDRVFAGKHHLGGRELATYIPSRSTKPDNITKTFFGPDGNVLKTVHYNPKTGLREFAKLPDGRCICYDAKGLPTFTEAKYDGGFMNLGGLDKLI